MKRLLLLVLLIQCVSCKKRDNDAVLYPEPANNSMDIKYSGVLVDTIILNDEGVETSLDGVSGINSDKDYYFIDKRECWYNVFDLDGNFKKRSIGKGPGPKEIIGRFATCCILDDSSLFIMGFQNDFYVYDKNFDKKNLFTLPYSPVDRNTVSDMTTDWRAYSPRWSDLICRNFKNKAYMNIYSENPDFNYFSTPDEYLKKSNHIWEVDIESKQAGKLYATGYPPIYHTNRHDYAGLSFTINFDIDKKGNFYVSYEADPLIYKYDNDYKPLYSFGYAGKNMDIKLKKITDFPACGQYEMNEKKGDAYYDWVEYIDETELLFRSYKKGSHDNFDGLQIYSDTKLLADISVPKGLRVAGYVAPYYYSQVVVDEEKEIMKVYRFKLKDIQ
jgi:hypothetical protein